MASYSDGCIDDAEYADTRYDFVPVFICALILDAVCHMCVTWNFFPTNPYLQAGLTDLDEIWHDGRSLGVASPKNFVNFGPLFLVAQIFDHGYLQHFLTYRHKILLGWGVLWSSIP